MTFDPLLAGDLVTSDVASCDPDFPPSYAVTHFISEGSVVPAHITFAEGSGPHATVIVSGDAYFGTFIDSLIAPLVLAGMNVMTFIPRGMWDDSHEYAPLSAMDDVSAAVEFLRTASDMNKVDMSGRAYRVDPDRIGVMGMSGGGGAVSLSSTAANDAIAFAMAFGPANHELHRDLSILHPGNKAHFDFVKSETAGRVDIETRARNMTKEDIDRISVINQAPNLVDKKVLLVGALHDSSSPLETAHVPIAKALRAANARHFTEVVLDTDGSYLSRRIALARIVISWLRHEQIL